MKQERRKDRRRDFTLDGSDKGFDQTSSFSFITLRIFPGQRLFKREDSIKEKVQRIIEDKSESSRWK